MTSIQKYFKYATFALLSGVGLFIVLTFTQYGLSNDEPVQHQYGRLLLAFYASGFTHQAAFHYINLYLYGGLFDLIAAGLEKISPFDIWDMRHLLSAFFGLLGFVAVYKTTTFLSSTRAGFFAVLLLLLTGAWTGAMFTHTKDIPFATFMAWALYYTVLLSAELPNISKSVAIKLGVAIGCALGIRIGGGFAVVYLFNTLLIASLTTRFSFKTQINFWRTVCATLWITALVSFVLMAIFWPWGVMSPSHPLEAIKAFSHFSFDMTTIVDGKIVNVGEVPNTYLLHYLWVKLPESFLLGLLSFFLVTMMALLQKKPLLANQKSLLLNAVLIAALFPLIFVLLTSPALYNGLRHFTFVLPPLAVLAGLGIEKAIKKLRYSPKKTLGFATLFCVLVGFNGLKLVQFHPYEYVAYNVFAGETATLNQRWEVDYWSSGLLEAAHRLNQLPLPARDTPYLVAICADDLQGGVVLNKHFLVTKNWTNADFFISSTQMHCEQVLLGKVVGEVKRQGLVITQMKDRRQLVGDERLPRASPNRVTKD